LSYYRTNNRISAPQLRVIDEEGTNLGVLSLAEASKMAQERGLDLIEVSPNAAPPIAKIMEYGKFLYQEQKKAKVAKGSTTETKVIKITLGTSEHDLEQKAKKISEFLKDKDRVLINLVLRGRAKGVDRKFAQERMERILKFITEPYKIASPAKSGPAGITITIEHSK
jgi:translation initiation factor IF-3